MPMKLTFFASVLTLLCFLQGYSSRASEKSLNFHDSYNLSDWLVKGRANSLRFYDPDSGKEINRRSERNGSYCMGKDSSKPGKHSINFWSNGRYRRAKVYLPESYRKNRGSPLVLNIHAFMSNGTLQESLSNMLSSADQRGFIMVYPEGILGSWNGGACCGGSILQNIDDVSYINDLLDRLEDNFCIDASRVYATGMSNGGFMSYRLACEMSDRIAAIAPVASVLGLPRKDCQPVRSVPLLSFHGTNDPLVPYKGGLPLEPDWGLDYVFRSVDSTMSIWTEHNSCSEDKTLVYRRDNVRCYQWQGCGRQASTIHCKAIGDTHTWPHAFGGWPTPATTRAINASESIFNFFDAHQLPL